MDDIKTSQGGFFYGHERRRSCVDACTESQRWATTSRHGHSDHDRRSGHGRNLSNQLAHIRHVTEGSARSDACVEPANGSHGNGYRAERIGDRTLAPYLVPFVLGPSWTAAIDPLRRFSVCLVMLRRSAA